MDRSAVRHLRDVLDKADAVVIGAGAGLSTSAGFTYSGERFEKHFSNFREKYGFTDMYSGSFYPYVTPGEMWALRPLKMGILCRLQWYFLCK